MPSRLVRLLAGVLTAALLAAPAAQSAVVFKGFSAKRAHLLRSDLGKSSFPFSALLDVVVKPGDLPKGALGLATSNGVVVLDEEVFVSPEVRTFALLHELSHQIDYQLMDDAGRGRFYEAAGFGAASDVTGYADHDWYDGKLVHAQIPAEQFASAVPLVVWPVAGGDTYVGEDGSCIGWEGGEGCRAPLDVVRAIVDAILAQHGLPSLGGDVGSSKTFVEAFVPPMTAAPGERPLRTPDAGVASIATTLTAAVPLAGVTAKKEAALRVRLAGPLGAVPDASVVLDVQVKGTWWELATLLTNAAGEVTYRFRAKGWKPTAFRLTFAGAANLAGSSLVVPVAYAK
jgi:hypothetical protein